MKCEVCLSEEKPEGGGYILRTFDIQGDEVRKLLNGIEFTLKEHLSGVDLFFKNQKEMEKAKVVLSGRVYSEGWASIEEVVGSLLKEKDYTLSTAESCTAGLLSARLVNVPGSSAYFTGGVVCYSNELKVSLLGVNPTTLEEFGAVSEETCREMLKGLRERFKTDCGVAITGIAGPGGSENKPEGLTYIGVFLKGSVSIEKRVFTSGRNPNRFLSSQVALNMLRKKLLEEEL